MAALCLPNHAEGEVDHETFQRVQAMIAENVLTKNRSAGAGPAKRGSALLSSLPRCLRCGRELTASCTGRQRNALRHTCCRGCLGNGSAVRGALKDLRRRLEAPGGLDA